MGRVMNGTKLYVRPATTANHVAVSRPFSGSRAKVLSTCTTTPSSARIWPQAMVRRMKLVKNGAMISTRSSAWTVGNRRALTATT